MTNDCAIKRPKMESNEFISDISISEMITDGSSSLKPYRIEFKDEVGESRKWDAIESTCNLVVIVYSVDRNCVIICRKFSVPVFVAMVKEASPTEIDFSKVDQNNAVTYDLFSFNRDMNSDVPFVMTVIEYVKKECGYDVPGCFVNRIFSTREGVGVKADLLHFYYVEVTDDMRDREVSHSFELHLQDIQNFLYDSSKPRTSILMIGLLWFLYERENFLKLQGISSPCSVLK
ncbi:hypothetical protein ACOME3_002449 [Neoechinorhynchus agilis]